MKRHRIVCAGSNNRGKHSLYVLVLSAAEPLVVRSAIAVSAQGMKTGLACYAACALSGFAYCGESSFFGVESLATAANVGTWGT